MINTHTIDNMSTNMKGGRGKLKSANLGTRETGGPRHAAAGETPVLKNEELVWQEPTDNLATAPANQLVSANKLRMCMCIHTYI